MGFQPLCPPSSRTSSIMSDEHAMETPGELLESLIWEHQTMLDFKAFVRRRFDLEKKHVESLRELRLSAEESFEAIWGLVSPFFSVLDSEIEQRSLTTDSLSSLLDQLPKAVSPNEVDEDGNVPTEVYKDLATTHELYEKCKADAVTMESVTSLTVWNNRKRHHGPVKKLSTVELQSYEVPELDRRYREAVLKQRSAVRVATKWHKRSLPERLDAHHDHVEEVQSLVCRVASQFSTQNAEIVRTCSTALKANAAFSTSKFISQSFESADEELSHDYFRSVPYYNFALNGRETAPIFGTSTCLELAEEIMTGPRKAYLPFEFNVTSVSDMLKWEEEWKDEEDVATRVKLLSGKDADKFLAFAFLSSPPSIRLDERDVRRFSDESTKKKIERAYIFIGPKHERLLKQLIHGSSDGEQERAMAKASSLLTHRHDCRQIIWDMWKHWNFEDQCPLPVNITRDWSGELIEAKATTKKGKASEYPEYTSTKLSFMGKRSTF